MINETLMNLTFNPELMRLTNDGKLVIKVLEAQWIQSWNMGIIMFIILILIIWNTIITYNLRKLLKEKQ